MHASTAPQSPGASGPPHGGAAAGWNHPVGQFTGGFSMIGEPHYTARYLPGDPSATFVQIAGTQRMGQWALALNVPGSVSAVPEPAEAALLVAGLATIGLARRRARD